MPSLPHTVATPSSLGKRTEDGDCETCAHLALGRAWGQGLGAELGVRGWAELGVMGPGQAQRTQRKGKLGFLAWPPLPEALPPSHLTGPLHASVTSLHRQ